MRKLKERLYTAATLVPNDARVADIGTDHGHLPIFLIQNGISSRVIACDIREKPLLSAKQNIEKAGAAGVELRSGDGLAPVGADEVDCIIIAGMGGDVISGILQRAPWVKNRRYTLILQPMTSADVLRRYLCENGFDIVCEKAVTDSGRLYTVIKSSYSGNRYARPEGYFYCGELNPAEPAALSYMAKQRDIALTCFHELTAAGRTQQAEYYRNLYNEISDLIGEAHGA